MANLIKGRGNQYDNVTHRVSFTYVDDQNTIRDSETKAICRGCFAKTEEFTYVTFI